MLTHVNHVKPHDNVAAEDLQVTIDICAYNDVSERKPHGCARLFLSDHRSRPPFHHV